MDRLSHRERLLSMKFSTVEACFSTPMLNITLPTFPFVLAFAVQGLQWQSWAIGLMAALPHICNCLQPLALAGLSRRLSIYRLLAWMFVFGSLPWIAGPFYPHLGNSLNLVFTLGLIVATLASSIATVAWSSAISEVVPERLAGRYFARRNLIYGAWSLVVMLVVGQIAERGHNTLTVFGWIFLFAGLFRMTGLFFLNRMTFPDSVRQKQSRAIAPADLLSVLRNRNYLWLCLFIGFWGLLLNAAMPFYTVFLVDKLGFGIGGVVQLTTISSLGGLLTLKAWGWLCERYGNRPVLQISALVWALTALLMWAGARPGWTLHLWAGYFIVGAMTAGLQLAQFNLMVQLAPSALRPAYVAVFLALTSFLTAIGPISGGFLLKALPLQLGTVLGLPIFSYHLLFVLSALGSVLLTQMARRIHEPTEQPLDRVWREMRKMRAFNPMLSILSVGELMLTPRGLVALGHSSLRSVRRQVRGLEEAGEELLRGGQEAGAALFTHDKPQKPGSGPR
jgi:hypothetical protein